MGEDTETRARLVSDAPDISPGRARRGRLGLLVAVVALVALVAVLGAISLARSGAPGGAKNVAKGARGGLSATATIPKDWQTYHDPLGLFTIRIPSTWTATVFMGHDTISSPTGSMSGQNEEITLSDPAQRGSVEVQVSASQITSAFGRQWYCGSHAQEKLTLNGYPAMQAFPEDPPGSTWVLESSNAHFQIDTSIAGVMTPFNPGGSLNPPTEPPAPPQATVTADQALLAAALASFLPATGPLTCS